MPHHRRIVLSLHHGAASRSAMRHAAEMARLLDVGLTGIFVEDEAVHGLAAMPFAREFRLPSHDWQPIDPARIAEAFRHEAAAVQRSMDLEARGCGVACAFEVRRGDPFGSVGELLEPADMIVLAEPAVGADGLTQPFLRAWQTARVSGASVMLLPAVPIRRAGPIVVLATGSDAERAAETADNIARKASVPLVAVGEAPDVARIAGATRRIVAHLSRDALRFALGDLAERLIVLDRDALDDTREAEVLRVAAERGTPVLLVGGEIARDRN